MTNTNPIRRTAPTVTTTAAVIEVHPEGQPMMQFPLDRSTAIGLAKDILAQVERYDEGH
ncbi:hypothetical protein MN032_15660 [Agromyces atrinae]|uniref:hypothetical protein n=1 Tax=Agromyces atrinae TaxID=592376 RepID=UPI001F570E69|nr:hypothetical protein [Agromyces atrinae]MCI2959127.1 hypothetical protein [Agromyces atrinae]